MTCQIHSAGNIELYFYGELSMDEREAVQSHLKQCAICRQALNDLSIIRAALASRPDVATPPGGDWSGFMTRLDTSIQRLSADPDSVQPSGTSARVLSLPLRRRIVACLATAAVLTLVTASVVLVMRQRDHALPVTEDSPGRATVPVSQSAARETVPTDPALVTVSGAHFERSKLVVLGLATRDSTSLRADEWSRDRKLAATLLNDTRLYRVAAEERGMSSLAGVMRDLELVLLQTSMSEEPDSASIEQLQRLIRRRDLLTKMNMVATSRP